MQVQSYPWQRSLKTQIADPCEQATTNKNSGVIVNERFSVRTAQRAQTLPIHSNEQHEDCLHAATAKNLVIPEAAPQDRLPK
jgi:hypothetical protein